MLYNLSTIKTRKKNRRRINNRDQTYVIYVERSEFRYLIEKVAINESYFFMMLLKGCHNNFQAFIFEYASCFFFA